MCDFGNGGGVVKKRENGPYWCRNESWGWEPALWQDGTWLVFGGSLEFADKDFTDIIEVMITKPEDKAP